MLRRFTLTAGILLVVACVWTYWYSLAIHRANVLDLFGVFFMVGFYILYIITSNKYLAPVIFLMLYNRTVIIFDNYYNFSDLVIMLLLIPFLVAFLYYIPLVIKKMTKNSK